MTFRKKLENFFYYYKWHTLAAVFIIAIVGFSVHSSMTSYEPDLNMVYVSDKPMASDTSERFEKSLKSASLVSDVNGDGKVRFLFEPMVMSMDSENADYTLAQKLQVYMFAGSQSVMFLHQYVVEDYDGAFEDMSSFAGDRKTVVGKEGYVTAVSVEGSKYLESLGINTENLYITVHRRTEKDIKKGKLDREYELAHKIVKFVLEQEQ